MCHNSSLLKICQKLYQTQKEKLRILCISGGRAAAAAAVASCRGRVSSLASFSASESGNAYRGWISGALALPAAGL